MTTSSSKAWSGKAASALPRRAPDTTRQDSRLVLAAGMGWVRVGVCIPLPGCARYEVGATWAAVALPLRGRASQGLHGRNSPGSALAGAVQGYKPNATRRELASDSLR